MTSHPSVLAVTLLLCFIGLSYASDDEQRSSPTLIPVNSSTVSHPPDAGRMAVVYLVPKKHNSSTFRRGDDSLSNLRTSIQLLYENVMGWQDVGRVDVLLFHTGDFAESDLGDLTAAAREGAEASRGPFKPQLLQRLKSGGGGLKLLALQPHHWHLPAFLHQRRDVDGWMHDAAKSYTAGYFNMLRFFGILVFKLTQSMGYAWVMRLDDDSVIKSPVTYDLVSYMQSNQYEYGYRISQTEGTSFTRGFPEALHLYISMFDIQPTFLYEHCTPPSLAGLVGGGWDRYAYYNNWFIAKTSAFTSRSAVHFLAFVDRIGGIYTQRWGDALIHTAAVQMLVPKERVREFTDFQYKHSWIEARRNSHCHWGDGLAVTPAEP